MRLWPHELRSRGGVASTKAAAASEEKPRRTQVGAGKSALDIAAAAAAVAKSVTIVQRTVHWPLAPFLGGIIPYELAAYARTLNTLNVSYYNAFTLTKIMHFLFVRFPS